MGSAEVISCNIPHLLKEKEERPPREGNVDLFAGCVPGAGRGDEMPELDYRAESFVSFARNNPLGGTIDERMLSSTIMRATITVDGELAERIERLSQERATSFEALATAALREGLEHLAGKASGKGTGRISFTHPVSLGGCLLDSLDDIPGALAVAEGEGFK